jgi:hypothetical protein
MCGRAAQRHLRACGARSAYTGPDVLPAKIVPADGFALRPVGAAVLAATGRRGWSRLSDLLPAAADGSRLARLSTATEPAPEKADSAEKGLAVMGAEAHELGSSVERAAEDLGEFGECR